jgi:hypothetical protein
LNSFLVLEFEGTVLLKVIWFQDLDRRTDRLTELIYKIGFI